MEDNKLKKPGKLSCSFGTISRSAVSYEKKVLKSLADMKDSNHSGLYIDIYSSSSYSPHTNTTEPTGPEELSVQRGISCNGWDGTVNDQPGKS
jgi:hypothetical protein